MSKEFWAIVTVGVGVGGLVVALGTLMVISLGSINARLDSMETHFNTRLDSMETHFNTRLDSMETHFNARFDTIEARLTAMESRMHDLNTRVGRIEGRLDIFTEPALE